MVTLSVGIGLIASFVFTELTGLSAGGLIVPGYLALYLDQPARVAATLFVSLATYLVVRLLSGYIIIYGRRRFMSMVLAGFWMGWLMTRFAWQIPFVDQDLRAIGYVVPGLIANEAAKHGVVRTFASVLLVSAAVRLALLLMK